MYYIVALFVLLLDQATKWIIANKMEYHESIKVIDHFLYITSHRNQGAAWGILQGQMWFFYLITVVVIIGIVYYIQKHAKGKPLLGMSLGLMLGGAIGNFIDRAIRHEVVDFIDTYIFSYDFPIFNVADAALTVGVILLMIYMFKEERETKEKSYGESGTQHSGK
ncbi:signal peptidase II [Falsibacillus albus]|uniref:Lipoprotein signal peptidase n=1 Tax=Falsibacillus albus TaxID=2478915 RepID=A0A3L7JZ48_9BACI|nr:signal peptidase II [Falsibacillus albus]RLQ95810.1 lipoprotein signal peptidase [Falsibacillus albus]